MWYSQARRMPVKRSDCFMTTGMARPQRYILHIADGRSAAGNVAHWETIGNTSTHFSIEKDGTIVQHVDTDHIAKGMGTGNSGAIQAEHIGFSGDALTDGQLASTSQLLAWLHFTYNVPIRLSGGPGIAGVGYHRQYLDPIKDKDNPKAHWHCPGTPVIVAIPIILDRARALIEDGSVYFLAAGNR
jgi:hypothetical protein